MNIRRFEKTLQEINRFNDSNIGITRLAYTDSMQQANEYFITLCKKEGLKVKIDQAGNIIARREGRNPNLPAVCVGSHLDTVIQGGRYDGAVGVMAGLEIVRSLNDKCVVTEHPIELIAFACEESARFGVSTVGSKAMAGLLKKEKIADLKDKEGIRFSDALALNHLDILTIENAARSGSEMKVFLELHIEQGPVLENEKKQVGIVHTIAAPTRLKVKVEGKASHSGTTPMLHRKDALMGACEIALELEHIVKSDPSGGVVGTVGVFQIQPGAMNVIPGQVDMGIDIRSTSAEAKSRVFQQLRDYFTQVEQTRGLSVTCELISDEEPCHLDEGIVRSLETRCEELGIAYRSMYSGAGHDAMNVSSLCPTGLIFIPSKDGLSHHPDEFTKIEDVAPGILLLEQEVLHWAIASNEDQHRLMGKIS